MPRPVKSPTPDLATRARILAAALDLFATHGFAGTTVRMLARKVDLTEAALYHHFEGKGDVFTSLIQSYMADVGGGLQSLLDESRGRPLREVLLHLARSFGVYLSTPERLKLHRVLLTEAPRLLARDGAPPESLTRPHAPLIAFFADLAKKGAIDLGPLDAEGAAIEFMAPIALTHMRRVMGLQDKQTALASPKRVEAHVDFVLAALKAS